jgi:hypothetical protein
MTVIDGRVVGVLGLALTFAALPAQSSTAPPSSRTVDRVGPPPAECGVASQPGSDGGGQ